MSDSDHLKSLKKIKSNLYGNLKNNQQKGYVDCCKKYKFNLEMETKDFNNTVNSLGIVHLLMDDGDPKKKDDHGFDLTEMLERDINAFVKIGTCMILGIIGNVGSGKSELAQLLTLLCMKANKIYRKKEVDYHLCWEMKNMIDIFPMLKKGDVVWKDEMPKATRKGSRVQEWEVDNVLRIIRAYGNTFIFVDPLEIKVDICNLYFESAGMNRKERSNRFLVLNKNRRYIGHIYVKLHEVKTFRNNYLKEKNEFIQRSLKNKGFSGAENNDKNNTKKESNKSKIVVGKFPFKTIEHLKKHLKTCENRITIKEYMVLIKCSEKTARGILNKFVDKKELNYFNEGRTMVYYSRK